MKKKLFRSFIVSLFVFTLFITVSNAEITANKTYTYKSQPVYFGSDVSVSSTFSGQTEESFIALLEAYRNNPTETTFRTIYDLCNSIGYGYVCGSVNSVGGVYFYAYKSENHDIGICMGSDELTPYYLVFEAKALVQRYWFSIDANNTLTFRIDKNYAGECQFHKQNYTNVTTHFGLANSVKQLSYVSDTSFKWDGVFYYTQPTPEPEEPDFVGISDDEKATIINSVVNSNEFINIVPKNYRNQYFIVYSQWTNTYKIYFYPEQYYLKGRKFAEGEVDGLAYESYKIVAFEGSNFFWDLVQSVSPFQYYIFSGSFDSENEFSSYFYGYENSHELNQRYFSVQDEPIVYSSRDIGFVIFDLSTGEYVEDTENGIVSAPLVDSSGNEIIIEIPEEEGPESIGFWDSFLLKLKTLFTDLFGMLGATIEFLLNKLFDLPTYLLEQYGENVFTLVFAIIVKALEVLVSSISLLFRFAGFLLTLIAIPADSTLFNVLVDGKAWGIHFIEGLNFLKGLSWNNLSFWRLFEWFVASLEVIWTVRIVRRHYSQIM